MFNGLKRGIVICACAALAVSCMDYGPIEKEDFEIDNAGSGDEVTGKGLFITNEGNFMYGNASLSYYDPEKKHVENEVFARANAIKLGDVAQSMVIRNGIGWIVVNNSGVIYAIDINTFKEVGRITGFTSPRYIHFLSDEKAYVTQIWDPRIYIVNPKTYQITGYVETDMDFETGSTEQMVQYDKYVFTNCWSYQNRILVIDTETDKVCDQITVGIQPTSLVMDKYNKIWTVTDGGYEGSPYGHEAPSLYCIDAATRKIEKQFKFKFGDWPSEVQLNGTRDTIYFINKAVWRLPVTADKFPVKPFLPYNNTLYYGLTINPVNSEVYIADASLGVAIFLLGAPLLGLTGHPLISTLGIAGAAWIGSALILMLIAAVSRRIKDIMVILILGMMFSSGVGAIVQILQYLSNEAALKSFVVWTMGSLGDVTLGQLGLLLPAVVLGLVLAVAVIKPLNLLLLGENYARTMGLDIRRSRQLIFLSTTLLAGTVTAFCGPIGFIGLAVPHVARILFADADHRILVPASILTGIVVMLLCDVLAKLLTFPINTITALLGIPIVIWVVIRNKSIV